MAWQLIAAIPHASAVVDEPAHLTAGYLAITQGDLAVNREHPPLIKALAAIPLLFLAPALPPEPEGGWPPRGGEDFEFGYSRAFLYHANDADRLLALARLPVVALTLAAGLTLFLWGRALFANHGSDAGSLAALALFAFEPNLLAHGRLITTDMGAVLFTVAACACLERSFAPGRPGPRWAAAGGAALGLGLLTRFSCLLLIPLLVLAAVLDGRRPAAARARHLAVMLACALLLVNLGYGFAGFAGGGFPLAHDPVVGPLRTEPLASLEAHPLLRWTPLPVPRLYLEGLDLARYKNLHVEGPGYLNGAYSSEGWWSYFLLALGMKATLPLLALAAAGLGAAGLAGSARSPRDRGTWPGMVWLVVPSAGFLLLVTASTRAQIGLRYVLPVIPFLCLLGGLAASLAIAPAALPGRSRPRLRGAAAVLCAGLLIWHAAAALAIWPYHLAYFNEAAGGPDDGILHLADSNLDWGQDLVGLDRFMSERRITRMNLYYFGTADPDYYGIQRVATPEPGYYAVSATHLMGIYLPDREFLAPFRRMTPEATIGHSINVYHLDHVPDFLKTPIRRP